MNIDASPYMILRNSLTLAERKEYPFLCFRIPDDYLEHITNKFIRVIERGEDDFPFRVYAHLISNKVLDLLYTLKDEGRDYTRSCNYGKLSYQRAMNHIEYLESGFENNKELFHYYNRIPKNKLDSYKYDRNLLGNTLVKAVSGSYYYTEGGVSKYVELCQHFRWGLDSSTRLLKALLVCDSEVSMTENLVPTLKLFNVSSGDELGEILEDWLEASVDSDGYWTGGADRVPRYVPGTYGGVFKGRYIPDGSTKKLLPAIYTYLLYLHTIYEDKFDKLALDRLYRQAYTRVKKYSNSSYLMLLDCVTTLLHRGNKVDIELIDKLSKTLSFVLMGEEFLYKIMTDDTMLMYFNMGYTDMELYDIITTVLNSTTVPENFVYESNVSLLNLKEI